MAVAGHNIEFTHKLLMFQYLPLKHPASIRGVYRLSKSGICAILGHIPMVYGKMSPEKFFLKNFGDILPLNPPF